MHFIQSERACTGLGEQAGRPYRVGTVNEEGTA